MICRISRCNYFYLKEDVMLAGRDIGLCVGIMTMAATWIAGGFLNGSAEAAYSQGRGKKARFCTLVVISFAIFK